VLEAEGEIMARTLTPERQKLKQEALSLRYDYGLSERRIAVQLNLTQTTIHRWVNHNLSVGLNHNSAAITHLEGDCLKLLPTIPDKSVDVLLTDPPYSVMEDYEWDKKDAEFYHHWLSLVKPKLKDKYTGFIFCDARRLYEFEDILRHYFPINNRIIWIRKNMSMGRVVKTNFISSYEVIFYFGNRELDLPKKWGVERFDSCEFATPQSNFNDKKLHPTQKPINLILQLANVGTHRGDVVLDLFAGSGVVGKACQLIGGLKCILIEKEPEYNELIKKVINGRNHSV
jgi:DNA modification methylase